MAVGTRLLFPVRDYGDNFVAEMVDNTPRRMWDPNHRAYILRDQSAGVANSRYFLSPTSRQKFISTAMPRDGMRVSLSSGLKTFNNSNTAGFF